MPTTYNQGIARVDGGWIVSGSNVPLKDTDVIARVDENFTVITEVKPAIPQSLKDQGYRHVGDIDVVGRVIYAPLEQPDFELGHQATARYDVDTLAFIDSVTLAQHENSFVTVDAATMTAYSMDRFDGNELVRYDVANNWTPLPPLKMTMTLHRTQGADVADGAVWVSTDDEGNGVYRVDLKTGDTTRAGTLGHIDGEGEGFDATPTAKGRFTGLVIDLRQGKGKVVVGYYDLDKDDKGNGTGPWVIVAAVGAVLVLVAFAGEWAWRRRRSRP